MSKDEETDEKFIWEESERLHEQAQKEMKWQGVVQPDTRAAILTLMDAMKAYDKPRLMDSSGEGED